MSIHIGASKGDIAETVLLPGDPMRAKLVAETYLQDVKCYNQVRGMLGYTGLYKGQRISIQGTGMGQPSLSIYVHELIRDFGCQNLIRVGSCGSMHPDVKLRDVLFGMSSSTDGAANKLRFKGMDYAAAASFPLLMKAYEIAKKKNIPVKVGNILASDMFYNDNPDDWKLWAKYGVMAVEMESNELYTVAAKFGVNALCILTVSDSLVTHEVTTSEERQNTFMNMMEIALELA